MKHVELVNCTKDTKVGNHRVEVYGDIRHLIYYRTEIVTVDHAKRQFSTIDYRISMSTTHAIGRYRSFLNRLGYKQVEVITC